jgi:hypothetical protein
MKTNLEKNMEKILNIPADTQPLDVIIEESRITPMDNKSFISNDDVMDDYYYARENLKSIIDNARNAIDDLASIAATSEAPRAYEVLSTLMKTIVDANKDLLELQKKVKQIKEDQPKQPNVTNALFVGSTSELQKLIRENN